MYLTSYYAAIVKNQTGSKSRPGSRYFKNKNLKKFTAEKYFGPKNCLCFPRFVDPDLDPLGSALTLVGWIRNPDPDAGGQKGPSGGCSLFEVVYFGRPV
jgi:hypothetical protein